MPLFGNYEVILMNDRTNGYAGGNTDTKVAPRVRTRRTVSPFSDPTCLLPDCPNPGTIAVWRNGYYEHFCSRAHQLAEIVLQGGYEVGAFKPVFVVTAFWKPTNPRDGGGSAQSMRYYDEPDRESADRRCKDLVEQNNGATYATWDVELRDACGNTVVE